MKEMPFRQSRRRVLRAVSVGVGSAVAGCLSNLTSEEPEKPERSENAPPLKWISKIDFNTYGFRTPRIYDQTIYTGGSFHVWALDADDGSERWRYEIDTPNDSICYSGKLDVADGTVYTAGCDQVYVFDDAGGVQWAVNNGRKHSEPVTVPAISDTALFIGGYSLVRRNRESGKQEWKTDISGATRATPVLGEDFVFVGTSTGALEALDRTTGEKRFSLKTDTDFASAPVIKDEIVFVGTSVFSDNGNGTGYLYAADINEERWLWRVETGQLLNDLPPEVHGNTVFVATDSGTLHAISVIDGSVRWTYETGTEHPAPPRVGDGNVYVAGGDALHAVDIETGAQRWQIDWHDTRVTGQDSPPLVTSDVLYVGTFDNLYSFDIS